MSKKLTNLYLPYSMVGNGVDTSDATITPETVLKGFIGYGSDGKVEGVYEPPEIPVSGDGFSVAKVTEYTPYSAAFSGVTEVIVSGIGRVGEEDWGEDYSDANGKYIVTDATYYETDEKKRVYKHETKNYWLMCYDDTENYWYNGGIYWVITEYESDSDPYSAVACVSADDLPVGVTEWYNMNYDMPVEVGIATTITNKPEQPLVLQGRMSTSYNAETMEWTFADAETSFTGFDVEPRNGEMYTVVESRLVGNTLGFNPGEMEENALVYSDPGRGEGATPQGRLVEQGGMFKATVEGVPCVYLTGQGGIDGDSWVYFPLGKTIKEWKLTQPTQLPENQYSFIGTMFCYGYGNSSGSIVKLAKDIYEGSSCDDTREPTLGLTYCPNHGWQMQKNNNSDGNMNVASYPADYKALRGAFHGKWMQFAFVVDGYTSRVYLNDELKIVDRTEGGDEYNYLCFHQPSEAGMEAEVYFGRMYAFDRALSEAEIARSYKKLVSKPPVPAKKLVPAIPTGFTSNTSMEGYVVNQSHVAEGYPEAWCVFNQDTSPQGMFWWSGEGDIDNAPEWISIEVPEAFTPVLVEIYRPDRGDNPLPFTYVDTVWVEVSDDGEHWEWIAWESDDRFIDKMSIWLYHDKPHRYFRFRNNQALPSAQHSGWSAQAIIIYREA